MCSHISCPGSAFAQQLLGVRHRSVHYVRSQSQNGENKYLSLVSELTHCVCVPVCVCACVCVCVCVCVLDSSAQFHRSLSENTMLADIIIAVAALEQAIIKDTGITSEVSDKQVHITEVTHTYLQIHLHGPYPITRRGPVLQGYSYTPSFTPPR